MKFGDFTLTVIRECHFKLDGGAVFGIVPKPVWQKSYAADLLNRVSLACNLLLIETGSARVLVETGMGARWNETERARYEIQSLVEPNSMVAQAGFSNQDIDHVVLSHMHFDHMGGAVMEKDGQLVPTFPRAKYYVQRGEYELAAKVNARGRASYRLDDYQPLEKSGQLVIVDGDVEIVSGVHTRVTGGHTSHHQIITWESCGQKGVYFADVVPTHSHLSPPWVMGYDHYPLQSCDIKDEWLSRCAAENWLVVFDHEIGVPWGYVKRSPAGKFDWQPLGVETLQPQSAPLQLHPVKPGAAGV